MWLAILILLACVAFIAYIVIQKPEKLEFIDRVTSPKVEYFATGFAKPVGETSKKKTVRHEPPECLVAGDGPEDLECPKPHTGGTKYKNEERCRKILEKLYPGHKFPSVRPNWLKNPATKRNLELDMYCHELRIAGEYDGKQHFQKTKFHKSKKDVIYQFRKDEWKAKRCQELGITLIRVPYWVRPEELENFIKERLIKLGKLNEVPSV